MTTDIIDEMLRNSKTIAVVGMSDKPNRPSYNIGRYLAGQGYRVLPVNPVLKEIDGQPVYGTLDEAQAATKIDMVDVFRASENVPPIVDDVIRLGIPYLWLQDGVVHDESIARAEAAGVKCIQNDCIFRQHAARVR
jgi:uncharacterized protein